MFFLVRPVIRPDCFMGKEESSFEEENSTSMVYIGVVGDSHAEGESTTLAFQVGRLVARNRATLICGGLGGVMQEACRGARSEGGTTIGILPGERRDQANAFVDIPIVTGMGEARNLIIVRSSDAMIAISGGYGTLSEIAFALKLGVPLVGIRSWDLSQRGSRLPYPLVETADEAVEMALGWAASKA